MRTRNRYLTQSESHDLRKRVDAAKGDLTYLAFLGRRLACRFHNACAARPVGEDFFSDLKAAGVDVDGLPRRPIRESVPSWRSPRRARDKFEPFATMAKNLERLRFRAGQMTVQQLSEKMEVSLSTVSIWESGRGFCAVSRLPQLAKVLGCRVQDFFEGTEAQ